MWRLKLSYLYWKHHPWRLLNTSLFVMAVVGLTVTATYLLGVSHQAYRGLVLEPLGRADLHLVAMSEEGMYGTWQMVLEDMPELAVTVPILHRQTFAIYQGQRVSVGVQGVDPQQDTLVRPVKVQGRWLSTKDSGVVVLSAGLAKQLGIGLGESLELVTPLDVRSYTVVGLDTSNEVGKVVIAPLAEVQELFTSGQEVDGFDLVLASGAEVQSVATMLSKRLAGVATVMTPLERVRPVRYLLLAVRGTLLTIVALSLLVVLCVLVAFVTSLYREREEERGMLYLFGLSQPQLTRWQSAELSSVIGLAAVIGLLFAFGSVHVFDVLEGARPSGGLALLVGLATSSCLILFALLWLWLQPYLERSEVYSRHRWLYTLPSRVWLSWQFVTRLGQGYWLAVSMLALSWTGLITVAAALGVQHAAVQSWVEQAQGQPILDQRHLQLQEEVPLSDTTRWNMAMLPGVAFTLWGAKAPITEEGFEASMYVFDMPSFPYQDYLQSEEGMANDDLAIALRSSRNLAISESLSRLYGFKVGMRLRLSTPSGEHGYKIVAVLKDIDGLSKAIFIERRIYLQDWERNSEGLYLLSLEEKARPAQVANLLREQLSRQYPGVLWSAAAFKSELERLLETILSWCRWLMIFFVALSLVVLLSATSARGSEQMLSTLYTFGGQRRLLSQLTLTAVFFSLALGMGLATSVATGLSYWLVEGLRQSSDAWVWQAPVSSYLLSILALLVVTHLLSYKLTKHYKILTKK